MSELLKVENVSKVFYQGKTEIQALKDVSFTCPEKRSMAIVGPSGSGKTTLLSLLAGLDAPSKGSVQVANQKLESMDEQSLAHYRATHIGIVFQQFHLMSHLTAEENITLPLEIVGAERVTERAHDILEKVGMYHRKDHLPHQMSGGECQRIAIARASVIKPKLLLADEPSGNLDTDTGKKVMDLLFSLIEQNHMTMVLVTHDLQLAARCHSKIQLMGGRVQ